MYPPFKCVTCSSATWLNPEEQAIVGSCGRAPSKKPGLPHDKPYFFGITAGLIALVVDCPQEPTPAWLARLKPEILESWKAVTPRKMAEYFKLVGITITASQINAMVYEERSKQPPRMSRRRKDQLERRRRASEQK